MTKELIQIPDYEKMYFALMAKVADAIDLLVEIQRKCEEMYISSGDDVS